MPQNLLDITLRRGACFWTAGNNGTILRVDRERLAAGGVDPLEVCPGFADAPSLALKILHKNVRGLAEAERAIHMAGHALLHEMSPAPTAGMPRVFDGPTGAILPDPLLLTKMTGLTAVGGHVEYLFMDWVDGTDFALLVYRAALRAGLRRTREEYGRIQAREEARSVLRMLLDCQIMTQAQRLDPADDETPRAQRIGGQLRTEIREGRDPLSLWNRFLPEARNLALAAFQCGDILDAMSQLRDEEYDPLWRLIGECLDATALETAIAAANAALMEDYVQIRDAKGRREGFYRMVRDLILGEFALAPGLHGDLRAALLHLNGRGYHHNDLHERNIMVSDGGGRIIIIDLATATLGKQEFSGDLGLLAPGGLFHAATLGAGQG